MMLMQLIEMMKVFEWECYLQKSALQSLQLGRAPSRPKDNGDQRTEEYLISLMCGCWDIGLRP